VNTDVSIILFIRSNYIFSLIRERREKVLVGKPGGKRPLRRQRHRWEDGIRMDIGRLAGGGVDSIGS
jgi:hypothetical protein